MTKSDVHNLLLAVGILLFSAGNATAANINAGAGYTNDFSVQPAAADWSSRGFGMGAGDITSAAALDAAVQTTSASSVTAPCASAAGNPPNASATAAWSSTGNYLQTRPTANAATLLMATLVNNTGTEAAAIHLNYDYATNRAGVVAEEARGQRVYYSLSGATNSWSPIAELSQTSQGALSANVTLAAPWKNGSKLYLLWADDNGSGTPDDANDIDNFFVSTIGGPPRPASCDLVVPDDGQAFDFLGSPTPVTLTATAHPGAEATITGVGFYDVSIGFLGSALESPYTTTARLNVGIYNIYAVATNSLKATLFSRTNAVIVAVPPTNTAPPSVATQVPLPGSSLTNLTNITVVFSEPVQQVDAADLLVNGMPATGVSGGGSNHTFTFPRPPYGEVNVAWAANHGISDFGYPAVLPFDGSGSGSLWGYYLFDQTPPTVSARIPAAGAIVTNLAQISVSFSEPVNGVDAADLLLNGTPALDASGSGANYAFSVRQPPPGTMNVSWATNHGILDQAASPNAFNAAGPGARWSFTLDTRTVLVQTNSTWQFLKGRAEASTPTNAWRQIGFDAASWSSAPAPFFYGDPYSNGVPAFTLLSDMQGNYSTIYLRQEFTVTNRNAITNLLLSAQSDDGFLAWLNGVEVLRINAPAGEVPFNGTSPTQSAEPQNNGAAFISYTLTNAAAALVNGTNVLAVHALNQSLGASSDFGFNAQLYTYLTDLSSVAPRLAQAAPAIREALAFTNLTVTFSESVGGVEAGDLLVNGVPASGVSSIDDATYTFHFPEPSFGPVVVTWTAGHGIADFDSPPKMFDGTAPASTLRYSLVNPGAPTVAAQKPPAGAKVSSLAEISVTFSEPVSGVDAADLLVNGKPAGAITGSGADYIFTFSQPAYGAVSVTWAANSGIADLSLLANAFDGTRPVNAWGCTLVDQIAPAVAAPDPPAGSAVVNLTQLTVAFTEPVAGVTANDLLINGRPASGVTGSNAIYTFTFPPPNSTLINVAWAASHGIHDLAVAPNPFDAAARGAVWSYTTLDAVPPALSAEPPPAATVRWLTQIMVTFDEPVSGLDAGDLLIDNVPARQMSGTGSGPYTFVFSPPTTNAVQVTFAPGHGIQDLAAPPNPFGGATWTYVLNPAIPTDVAVSHVVQISLDGLGATYLVNYVSNAPAQFPNFVRLMTEGAFTFNARCDYDISETVPNHASMFTGRPVFQPIGLANPVHHGYNNNFPAATETLHNYGNTNVAYKASMFDVAHDYGRATAFYAGKTRLDICERSYDVINGAPDFIGLDNGRGKIDLASVANVSGAAISNEVNTVLQDLGSATPKHYSFIHIAEPDLTGHATSWGSANWSNAVRNVDAEIGRIMNVIDTNPVLLNRTALIITADHGGGGVTPNAHTEAYHIANYTVPFFVRAPGIPARTDLYTLLANRANPGTNRTDYTTQPQPIRNSDGSNLALSLMGLPPIPGSFIVPVFATPAISLRIAQFEGKVSLFWADPSGAYALEACDALSPSTPWRTITEGITVSDTVKVFTFTNPTDIPVRYFRLKKQ